MKPAILLFLLVFAGAGCGVEGEEIARDFSGDCGARFKANTQIYTGMPTMTGFSRRMKYKLFRSPFHREGAAAGGDDYSCRTPHTRRRPRCGVCGRSGALLPRWYFRGKNHGSGDFRVGARSLERVLGRHRTTSFLSGKLSIGYYHDWRQRGVLAVRSASRNNWLPSSEV